MSTMHIDPKTPFYMFESGGTGCARIEGIDDGKPFVKNLISLHVNGLYIEDGNEKNADATMVIALQLESAEQLLKNLAQTIEDFKKGT